MVSYQRQTMQEKDKFLRKINFILLLLLIFVSQKLVANNTNTELLDYNNMVEDIKVEDIKIMANKYLNTNNYVKVVLYPQK